MARKNDGKSETNQKAAQNEQAPEHAPDQTVEDGEVDGLSLDGEDAKTQADGEQEQAKTAADEASAPSTTTGAQVSSAVVPQDPEEIARAQRRAELEAQLHAAQQRVADAEARFAVVRRELDERCEARDAQVNAIDRAIGEVRGEVEKINQQLHQVLRPAVDKINRKLAGLA